MSVELLEIPDDTQALPRWLESQLVGTELAALVAQLEAVHGASTSGVTSLDELLGGSRASILRDGLGGLKSDQLRKLLVNPRLLLDLQEALLLEGGPYWTRQAQSGPQNQEYLSQGRRRIERFLASETAAPAVVPLKPRSSWSLRDSLIAVATAAVVLIAVSLYQEIVGRPIGGAPPAVAWGWAKPGALPEKATREEYLNNLAKEANEWFNKKPNDPQALAQRIAQFRQGCSVLMLSPHPALPPADRTWLVAKCKAWAGKLDEQLAALEGGADVTTVRDATDGIVNKLMEALKARASEQASAA